MKNFTKILVWVDSKDDHGAVLERAIRLAKVTGAGLELVDVVTPVPVYLTEPRFGYPALSDTLTAECDERLAGLAAFVREAGVAVDSKALYGRPETAISKYVREAGCDLVMISGEPSGTANRVLRVSPAPVWAVKPDDADPYQDILACVDPLSHDAKDNTLNARILDAANGLVELEGGRALLAYAYGEGLGTAPDDQEVFELVRQEGAEKLDALAAQYPQTFPPENRLLLSGSPSDAVPAVLRERDVDLIILGTRGRTGVSGLLLGNTAERILASADCSVLALKPDDFDGSES